MQCLCCLLSSSMFRSRASEVNFWAVGASSRACQSDACWLLLPQWEVKGGENECFSPTAALTQRNEKSNFGSSLSFCFGSYLIFRAKGRQCSLIWFHRLSSHIIYCTCGFPHTVQHMGMRTSIHQPIPTNWDVQSGKKATVELMRSFIYSSVHMWERVVGYSELLTRLSSIRAST